ncbi:uncharacterized protein LOC132066759 [Lycium ferocissimum]|uniref:uncharacterized protein LOC132066759 n=1 Tax=Lycium ferocissimum TaxID=112874 RepID=UPI0028156F5D|nr:uncharacterized protein LOC132066759 [Lycium ferocissimum]
MVRLTLSRINGENLCTSMPLAIGLFLSILALVALCAKHAKKPSRKSMSTHEKIKTNACKIVPRLSPLGLPNKNKNKRVDEESGNPTGDVTGEVAGEEGLWQKAIIMGEKCQPPQFSVSNM